jgi:soluble lytic murein transglycosylase-like protein
MKSATSSSRLWRHANTVLQDIRAGMVEVSRHGLALLGLGAIAITLAIMTQPELQNSAAQWLSRQIYSEWMMLDESDPLRNPAVLHLPPEQAQVTLWLSRKYKVSPRPLKPLVAEAWLVGRSSQLPPTLILAVMAVESRFNPFALGSQGAIGLMQIEPHSHANTLERFGGRLAVFDPLTNLHLGARLLQEAVQATGSVAEGLRQYAQASGQSDSNAYIELVLSEHEAMERVSLKPSTKASSQAVYPY